MTTAPNAMRPADGPDQAPGVLDRGPLAPQIAAHAPDEEHGDDQRDHGQQVVGHDRPRVQARAHGDAAEHGLRRGR
jgi:hypothetical protein